MIFIGQAHKQNIAVVKGDTGAIGTTEDQSFLSLSISTSKPPRSTSEGYSGYQVLKGVGLNKRCAKWMG